MNKGPNKANIYFEDIKKVKDTPTNVHTEEINKIKEYLECRYICEQDALWRLLGYDIHHNTPSVERLHVHLPLINNIIYKENTKLKKLLQNPNSRKTMLTKCL